MITVTGTTRIGNTTTISVSSDLTPSPGGAVYFYWYQDGVFVLQTTGTSVTFILLPGDQSVIDVLDSLDPNFDAIDNSPDAYPAKRTLFFIRSLDPSIANYRIDQQQNGGSWTTIGYVVDDPSQWTYPFVTPRLADLTAYAWRVVPQDGTGGGGNAGVPVTLGEELIVRTPEAPNFTATFNPSTSKVTFATA